MTFEVTVKVYFDTAPRVYLSFDAQNYTLQTHFIHGGSSIPLGMEVRYKLTKFEPHTGLERQTNP